MNNTFSFNECVTNIINFIANLALKKRAYVKTIPLQAWTGPEGSRRLRIPDFKTIGT
jgi:hypothetical protein